MEQMEPRQAISMRGGPGFRAQSCRPRAPLSWREQSLAGAGVGAAGHGMWMVWM